MKNQGIFTVRGLRLSQELLPYLTSVRNCSYQHGVLLQLNTKRITIIDVKVCDTLYHHPERRREQMFHLQKILVWTDLND